MSNRAQAQYLRIYDSGSTYVRWQTYYVNQTVTLDAASWDYMPFSASGIVEVCEHHGPGHQQRGRGL
jgi:hypothetical protein